jgi:hypothetical protein
MSKTLVPDFETYVYEMEELFERDRDLVAEYRHLHEAEDDFGAEVLQTELKRIREAILHGPPNYLIDRRITINSGVPERLLEIGSNIHYWAAETPKSDEGILVGVGQDKGEFKIVVQIAGQFHQYDFASGEYELGEYAAFSEVDLDVRRVRGAVAGHDWFRRATIVPF